MPRSARVLSAAQIKELAKKEGEYSVGGVSGLKLLVRKAQDGSLSVAWVLRKQGKDGFKVSLGAYPLISLKAARDAAEEVLRKAHTGMNPVEEKRLKAHTVKAHAEKKAREKLDGLTVEDLSQEFFDWREARGDWKDPAETRRRHEMRWRRHILLRGGKIIVSRATPDDIAELLRPIWCDYRTTADKLLPLLRSFFGWAVAVRKVRDPGLANPCAREGIEPLLPAERMRKALEHYPFLEPDQMPPFMAAIHRVPHVSARALEFAVLTCSRSQNVRNMRWSELNAKGTVWTIAAENMKITANGQHIVPLSRQAQEILKAQRVYCQYLGSDYVFPSPRNGKPYCVTGMNNVIRDTHADELAAGREGWIDREMSKEKGEPVMAVQHAISRASFETWAHLHGEESRIIDLCLHHNVDAKLQSAYDRDKSLEAKRALLQRWADFCLPK